MEEETKIDELLSFSGVDMADYRQDDLFSAQNNQTLYDTDGKVHHAHSNFYPNPCNYVHVLEVGDGSLNRGQEHTDAEENPSDTPEINRRPLRLKLGKSPSLEKVIEAIRLECSNGPERKASVRQQNTKHDLPSSANPMFEKLKATNFPASLLRIGHFTKVAVEEVDLVCKCYYGKQKLAWEILEGSLKKKIEIQWSNIAGLRATVKEEEPGILEIELHRQPLFFLETDPRPRKHTIWKESGDFTGGVASKFRRHYLQFRPGALDKQLEKLLEYDHRLFELSRRDYPSLSDQFFDTPVPVHLEPITNATGFNGGAPRFDPEVLPPRPTKYMRPTIQAQQFHPCENTVPLPYGFNDLTSPAPVTDINSSAGNVFHRQEMIPIVSPFEAYNLSLSESGAVLQHQDYRSSMMVHSDERINPYKYEYPSSVYDIASNTMIIGQVQKTDGSRIASMTS